jgi:pheromone shutdown-related protein TraB
MSETEAALPDNVSHINLGDKDVYLVGTAHVSQESVADVRATIEQIKPDSVCVELCKSRYEAMTKKDIWAKMDIFKVIKEKKTLVLLTQLVMSSLYRRLGEKLGIQPGAEMLEAISIAQQQNAQLVLADRDVQITLKRVWGYLGFWNKLKLMMHLTAGIFESEQINAELVEKIKKQDQLEAVMAEFTEKFPEIKRRLIDERDIFLSQKIRQSGGQRVVAVVGAGHIEGIKRHIGQDEPIEHLLELPPKSRWTGVLQWGIPGVIIGILVYGFFSKGAAHSFGNIYIWILTTGLLSAIGAAAGLAHPLAILAAFLAAPITTLHPLLAAGWFAGLAQAWIKRPTVGDFENLPSAISTVKGFWTNPVIKILLIIALSNLGSMLGSWVAGVWIAARSV